MRHRTRTNTGRASGRSGGRRRLDRVTRERNRNHRGKLHRPAISCRAKGLVTAIAWAGCAHLDRPLIRTITSAVCVPGGRASCPPSTRVRSACCPALPGRVGASVPLPLRGPPASLVGPLGVPPSLRLGRPSKLGPGQPRPVNRPASGPSSRRSGMPGRSASLPRFWGGPGPRYGTPTTARSDPPAASV